MKKITVDMHRARYSLPWLCGSDEENFYYFAHTPGAISRLYARCEPDEDSWYCNEYETDDDGLILDERQAIKDLEAFVAWLEE